MILATVLARNAPPHCNALKSTDSTLRLAHPLPALVLLIHCLPLPRSYTAPLASPTPCSLFFPHPLPPLPRSSTAPFASLVHCSLQLPPTITGLMLELSR